MTFSLKTTGPILLLFPHLHNSDVCVCVSCFAVCVFQIRWLLEDEIVSALRHSRVISSATLQKVAEHVLRSSGRTHCRCEDVPLQFVFGPEQSLEKFKEARTHTHKHTQTKNSRNIRISTRGTVSPFVFGLLIIARFFSIICLNMSNCILSNNTLMTTFNKILVRGPSFEFHFYLQIQFFT